MIDFKNFILGISSISTKSWDKLSTLFESRVLEKGDYFVREGQIAKELAFLETGIIRVFYRNEKGAEYNKQLLVNPCLIGGYASLITNSQAQINQQALTHCTIHVAQYSEIQACYSTFPEIERMARILAENLFVDKEQREIEIATLDAEKRYQIFKQKFPNIEQQIPQYHIASYLGITPTQLSRIRKKLSQKKMFQPM